MTREITEIGICTWDDLHEHWSPSRTVALVAPFRRMVNIPSRTGRAYPRRGIGSCLVPARMVTYWVESLGDIVTGRSSLDMVRVRY